MGQITEDTTFITSPSAISTELEGEAVILDTAASEYYGLNEVGTRIWSLLQEPKTLDEIVDVLLEEYSVDRDQCEDDVRELLNQMTEKNLLEVRRRDSKDGG